MSKLILTHEVTGLGAPGDVVDVKNGFARNYLIPQEMCIRDRRCAATCATRATSSRGCTS